MSCTTVKDGSYNLDTSDNPEEYGPEEFPLWLQDFRRAEIIFFGSIPFTVLFTNIGYGIYQSASNGFGDQYSISTFTQTASLTNDDRYLILGISAGISAGIAAADFVLGLFESDQPDE